MLGLPRQTVFVQSGPSQGVTLAAALSLSSVQSVVEGTSGPTYMSVIVNRTGQVDGVTTGFAWSVSGAGANPASASDFVGNVFPSGSGTFLPGEVSKTITIPISGDVTIEGDESFTLQVGSISHGYAQAAITLAGTILTDEVGTVTDITLTQANLRASSWQTKQVGTIESDNPAAVLELIDNDDEVIPFTLDGMFSLSGGRVRLESLQGVVGTSYSFRVRARTPTASVIETISLIVQADVMPAGLKEYWLTEDASKVSVSGGKVTSWTGSLQGAVVSQATSGNQPAWVTNTYNGKGAVRFNLGHWLDLTLGQGYDNVVQMIDAADQSFSILAFVKSATSGIAARTLVSLGNPATRVMASLRQVASAHTWSFLSGDNAAADASIASTAAGDTTSLNAIGVRVHGPANWVFQDCGMSHSRQNTTMSRDQARTATTVRFGAPAVAAPSTGANGNCFDGDVVAIFLFDRDIDINDYEVCVNLAFPAYGTPPAAAARTYVDFSGKTLVMNEDFDRPLGQIIETDQSRYFTPNSSRPWVPLQTLNRNQHGSPGATAPETGWLGDVNSPVIAPYEPIRQAVSDIIFKAQPMPAPLLSLNLNNNNGVPCNALAGSIISLGTQWMYPTVEVRFKASDFDPTLWPAFWFLQAHGFWPGGEIDLFEGLIGRLLRKFQPCVHNAPYEQGFRGTAFEASQFTPVTAGDINMPNVSYDYHTLLMEFDEVDGISFAIDRVYVGTLGPWNGVTALTIANGGSGVVADNGTANGSIAVQCADLYGAAPLFPDVYCKATLTVTAGVVTGASISKTGSNVQTSGTLPFTRTSGAAIGGGVALQRLNAAADPTVPTNMHEEIYALLEMAVQGVMTAPKELAVDYFRVWLKDRPNPAIPMTMHAGATAVANHFLALGDAIDARYKQAISNFIHRVDLFDYRFDRTPMTGEASYFNTSLTGLWSRLQGIGFFGFDTEAQARVNLKNPTVDGDLTKYGAPAFTARAGYQMAGIAGQAFDTHIDPTTSDLTRQNDNSLGVFLLDVPTNVSLASVAGCTGNWTLQASATQSGGRAMSSADLGGTIRKIAPEAGLFAIARRHRRYQTLTCNGLVIGKGAAQDSIALAAGNTIMIGAHNLATAGAAAPIGGWFTGQHITSDEAVWINNAFKQLALDIANPFLAIGADVSGLDFSDPNNSGLGLATGVI